MLIKGEEPYSILQKAGRYFHFLVHSNNRHGVHSPFVYDFIEYVLRTKLFDTDIEKARKSLLANNTRISIKDFGLGRDRKVSISHIAGRSLKKPKEAQIISKLLSTYKIERAIELGTSLGITTAYMARSNPGIKVQTIEGSLEILNQAREIWRQLTIENIESFHGEFDEILPVLLKNIDEKCLFFIDGNHSYASTLKYLNEIYSSINEESIIIFDDIHWSSAMEKAWRTIIKDERFTLSIDLFEMGIIFLNPRLKKEHFIIRY